MGKLSELSPADQGALEIGASLYDIGLISVPRRLIQKWQTDHSSLEPAERLLIERHPVLGQELAIAGGDYALAGGLIRSHHERFDGAGYPDKLCGEKIPWLARLLAVAVAFVTTQLSHAETVERIKLEAGSAFDPEAVRVFLRSLPMVSSPRQERRISLGDLRPGMVPSRCIYNSHGLVLLPEGEPLDQAFIDKLQLENSGQPVVQSFMVYC
jgi:response regulator RpfG family c-di-GMP phosphodiesterase